MTTGTESTTLTVVGLVFGLGLGIVLTAFVRE